MARKFIVRNRRKRKFIFTMLFILFFMIGVGYSTLSTKLNIGGSLEVGEFDDGVCRINSKLYNVLKCAVKDDMALEYTGAHQDSMDASMIKKKIYHWYAPNTTAGNNLANQILEKNNVVFAGHCWQMIRTTDTGGVKMIYNGEVEDGQCLNTRGTHVGIESISSTYLSSSYWYGTDYTYDSVNNTFKISGTTEQAIWDETTAPSLFGKYTCKGTSVDDTCTTLYYVIEPIKTESNLTDTISLKSSSHYSQFGKIRLGDYAPLYSLGYMYGPHGPSSVVYISSNTFPEENVLEEDVFSDYNKYSKNINYDGSSYSLVNPIGGRAVPEGSYEGYYTFKSSSTTSGTEPYYVIKRNNGSSYYHVRLNPEKQLVDFNMMIGDSLIDNGDGSFTLDNAVLVTPYDWASNYSSYKNKYACLGGTATCSNPRYITSAYLKKYSYVDASDRITISKTINGLMLTDTITIGMDEFVKNNSNYSNYKYTCGDTSTTCTEENMRLILSYNNLGYMYFPNHYFGSSVTWDGTNYTLVDVNGLETYSDLSALSTHHYICLEVGAKSCNEVAYIYANNRDKRYYYILNDGIESVDKLLENMLTKNTTDSKIKYAMDAWYKHSLLENYDQYIEDTIFCNDRSISSLGGWNPNGGSINDNLIFKGYNTTSDLSCTNETDKFSVSNNSAQLTYKVGLMTFPEMNLLTNDNIRKTSQYYYLGTPAYYSILTYGYDRVVTANGSFSYGYDSYGFRPAISLIPGIEFSSGNGSTANPYVVKMD